MHKIDLDDFMFYSLVHNERVFSGAVLLINNKRKTEYQAIRYALLWNVTSSDHKIINNS